MKRPSAQTVVWRRLFLAAKCATHPVALIFSSSERMFLCNQPKWRPTSLYDKPPSTIPIALQRSAFVICRCIVETRGRRNSSLIILDVTFSLTRRPEGRSRVCGILSVISVQRDVTLIETSEVTGGSYASISAQLC